MPKLRSTTVAINPEIYDQLIDEFCARYGPADDRGTKGQIFRCHMETGETVTITCYASTHNMSVQGLLQELWMDNIWPEIKHKLATPSNNNQNASICIQPTTSTPQRNFTSLPCFDLNVSTSLITDCPSTRSVETQTAPIPAPRLSLLQQQSSSHHPPTPKSRPVPAPRTSLSTKIRPTPAPRTSLCTQPTPAHISVPTIPTSNRFESLQTEHRSDLPQTIPVLDRQQPGLTSQTRTVLIIGDSIPKYLDGKRMSQRLNVRNECIRGSRLEHWIKLAPALIKEHDPSAIIIHCGTNNVQTNTILKCMDLTTQLLNVITSSSPQVTIAFSSLTVQGDIGNSFWAERFNDKLFELCNKYHLDYIDNRNIRVRHLARDNLHLGRSGIRMLARNYISFLKYFLSANMNT